MKNVKILALSALLASSLFGADLEKSAKDLANKNFKLDKEASALMLKIQKICEEKRANNMEAMKDLSPEQMVEFKKNLKYQMRQNMAKLGKDDVYFERICQMGKRGHHAGGYGYKTPNPNAEHPIVNQQTTPAKTK